MATDEEDDQRTTPGKKRSGEEDVDSRIKVSRCMKIEAAAQNGARCGLMGSWTIFHQE